MKMSSSMKKQIYNILLLLIFPLCFSCCVADTFDIDSDMEGETDVTATVVFSPITGTMDGTRTAGNAIKHINSLCILFYDKDDNFVRSEMVPVENIVQDGYKGTSPGDAVQDGHQAETDTPKANFTIKNLNAGQYRIYAVANMGDITAKNSGYDVSTPENLKNIQLRWNEDNIPANNQMFGYFTYASAKSSQGFDAPLLVVNRANNQLHAWVKRAASKVTVAVDGSELYPSVSVQIKSIQIKDIPSICYLGKDNKASSHTLIQDGETLTVADGAWSTITKNQPYYYYGMKEGMSIADAQQAAHSQTAEALYFFENMQGTGQSKKQVWPDTPSGSTQYPDGNNPTSDGYKDKIVAGTYVEVIGYYKNNAGEGPIIYRFMLGKDTDKDYNAQRNYHYKLTLKLKKNANDNDWHIVYDPEPDIYIPNPYYISYTYNETMNLPIKIMGSKLLRLDAQIIENGWHAEVPEGANPVPFPYYTGTIDFGPSTAQQYAGAGLIKPQTPTDGVWDGFLSLRKTKTAAFGAVEDGFGSGVEKTYTENHRYWYAENRGWRVYEIKKDVIDEQDGNYSVTTNGAGEWNASLPLYTRARVMVAQTGYTGNNPYVSYRRKAKVLVTAEIEDNAGEKHIVQKEVEIIQMRRVVNPKGIWRGAGKDDPFDVTMMILPQEDATEFEALISDGPWLAKAERGGDWYELEAISGYSQKNPDGTVSGSNDPYGHDNKISFRIRFKGSISSGARGGWIKIYYNNYSCIHKIFVRQGYDPVSFTGSNVKWHTCNLATLGSEVANPVVEGSYFRIKGNKFGLPIAASNNTESWFDKDGMTRDFDIEGGSPCLWSQTTSELSEISGSSNEHTWRLPTKADYDVIRDNPNTIYAYGVLYTDGTTSTQTSVADVYGARSGSSTVNKGIRGLFVCDSVTGTQIFFPIGVSGYGRFKQQNISDNNIYNRTRSKWGGVIQYANRFEAMPRTGPSVGSYGVQFKPLFWDLWRRHGAVYWTDKTGANKNQIGGLDINFYTMDIAVANCDDLGLIWSRNADPSGSDALQIRVVHDE